MIKHIHLIGCGSIGYILAQCLLKSLSIENFSLYDNGKLDSWDYVTGIYPKDHCLLRLFKIDSIKNHAKYVAFAEAGDDTEGGMEAWDLDDYNRVDNASGFDPRHLGGCNVTYLDGHSAFARMTNDFPQRGLPPFPYAWRPKYDLNDPDIAAWLQQGRKVYATLEERRQDR